MKKIVALSMTMALSILTVMAGSPYKMAKKGGHSVLMSTGEQPIVLAEFDHETSIDAMPNEVRSFLEFLTAEEADEASFVQFSAVTNDSVGPLLGGIEYDQGEPYNNLCPIINGGRAITGCVATAMAQVMRYWQYPQVGTGTATYTSSSGATTYDFSQHPFDWNNMLETYTNGRVANYNTTQAAAVANLMLACGASVNMDYDVAASGSFIVNSYTALKNNFGYSENIKYNESNSPNWESWTESLQAQFDRGLPVLYAGNGTSGGHAFVLDGYKLELLASGNPRVRFHVNWGWNGAYNGWFLLRRLQPSDDSDDYSNYHQCVVTNIYPKNAQGIEGVEAKNVKATKVFRDGQLVILKGDKAYNVLGAEL